MCTGVRSDWALCTGLVCLELLQNPLDHCIGWALWLQLVRATASELLPYLVTVEYSHMHVCHS